MWLIRSHRYYRDAKICYAYLAGLPNDLDPRTDPSFAGHEWFKRGWTLQELIAPKEVVFYTETHDAKGKKVYFQDEWIEIGRKSTMCERLSQITGIDSGVLSHSRQVRSMSVAKRMSWAARRKTTRIEDRAYCLMGLFGVNMSMIYGEGAKAFIRLQEEIMKESNDESLFAWRDDKSDPKECTGLLAESPEMFKDSGHFFGYYEWEPKVPFFSTNRGLQITLPLHLVKDDLYVAALNCPQPLRTDGFAGIYLKRVTDFSEFNRAATYDQYARIDSGNILKFNNVAERGNMTTIYVRKSAATFTTSLPIYPQHIVQLHKGPNPSMGYRLLGTMGAKEPGAIALKNWSWVPKGLDSAFKVSKQKNALAAVVVLKREDGKLFTVLLGSRSDIGDVAACVVDGCDESRTFGEWAPIFDPQPLGAAVELESENVCVDIESRIIYGDKYFFVNIDVEEKPSVLETLVDIFNETPFRPMLDTVPQLSETIPDRRESREVRKRPSRKFEFRRIFKQKKGSSEALIENT